MAWAGTVKSVCSDTGGVTVCWADGTESLIDIEELYRVDPEPLLELWDEYYGEEDDDEYEEDDDDSFNSEADDDDTSLTYRGLVNRLMDSLTGNFSFCFVSTGFDTMNNVVPWCSHRCHASYVWKHVGGRRE